MQGSGAQTETGVVRVTREGVASPHRHRAGTAASTRSPCRPTGAASRSASGLATGTLGIWIKQLDRGPFTRLTFGGQDRRPVWSPDGQVVAFVRDSLNTSSIFERRADGSTPERLLARLDRQVQEVSWSPDGRWLLLRTDNGGPGAGDIVGVRTSGRHDAGTARGERIHRAPPGGLARRALARLHLDRVRHQRGLRPAVSGHDRRALAGIERRWVAAALVARRPGAVLSRRRASASSPRRSAPGTDVRGQRAQAAVRRLRVHDRPVPHVVRRAARRPGLRVPRAAADGPAAAGVAVVEAENWFADVRARTGH